MLAFIRNRWCAIVSVLFAMTYTQLNTGCIGNGFFCPTGFPWSWEIWSDVQLPPLNWTVAVGNYALAVFVLILLFHLALPMDGFLWAQHGLAAIFAALFSWINPWRPTFFPRGGVANAGLPFLYRNVDAGLESKALLLLNLAIAFAFVMGLFLVFERMRGTRLPALRSRPPSAIKRWIVVTSLLFLFAHLNARGFWGYSSGFPFSFGDASHGFRPWAVLDTLIGVCLVVSALRYFSSTRRAQILAFTVHYVLANFEAWSWVRGGVGWGRGFPFGFYQTGRLVDAWLLASNAAIGLLVGLLVYRWSRTERQPQG